LDAYSRKIQRNLDRVADSGAIDGVLLESVRRVMSEIIWSDYFRYRVEVRGFDLEQIEQILRYSSERYYDTETGREVVVGNHDDRLVIIPYEVSGSCLTPVTIHATTRQQLRFRVRNGRFVINE
jgi:hypothetical protein